MGYKQDCPAFSNTHDSFLEDMGAHAGINSTEGVIQEKNGSLAVEGPSQTQSLTLSSTQVDTPLSNLDSKKKKEKKRTEITQWNHKQPQRSSPSFNSNSD